MTTNVKAISTRNKESINSNITKTIIIIINSTLNSLYFSNL